jgi:uncharacterized protein YjiS (DUF1127 family)
MENIISRQPHFGGDLLGIVTASRNLTRRFRVFRDRRAAENELRRLSLHLLADIGVEPDRISEVVDSMLEREGRGEARVRPGVAGMFTPLACPSV